MLAKQYRVALMLLMGSLAILGVVSAITETFYLKELAFSNANRKMIMFFEIQNSSATALDTILAIAMTLCLLNSKSGARRTDHVINLLVFFTMNTNLLTAIFQWIELILALTLSQTQIYSIFALMVPKLYFNSFLATLNSRDFMQSKLHESGSNQPVSISGMRFGPDHLIDGRTDSSGTADFEHELINKSISDGHEIEMGGRK
ncbi:hypothetical protein VKT23_011614 [Stygiomarasmius scandens]|uniref:DUF6534 domain-containing protein n=1 Tax=Marasmiellus scandens TaxID=2682957 RepID=A0ABR1J9M3_9AGAR